MSNCDPGPRKKWADNEELFIELLSAGLAWQAWVSAFFTLQGLSVEAETPWLRDEAKAVKGGHGDSPDLVVNGHRIEVKSRALRWTSPDDFPFQTAFIEPVRGWEIKDPKPFAYVLVSQVTGALIAIPARLGASHWVIEEKRDSVRGYTQKTYAAPRGLLRPINVLVEALR